MISKKRQRSTYESFRSSIDNVCIIDGRSPLRRYKWPLACMLFLWLFFQYNVVYSRWLTRLVQGSAHPVVGVPIAKIIHQSWKSLESLPLNVKQHQTIESWKSMNPAYTYTFWSDADIPSFVATYFPKYVPLFNRFPKSIMRSDFFRYLVVLQYGGVWSDIDTVCLKPISSWYPSASALVGVELDASDVLLDWWSLKLQFTQWTFAASPGHPLLHHVVEFIYRRYHDRVDIPTYVHVVTGPSIWTEAILNYIERHTNITSIEPFRFLTAPLVLGDIVILPVTAFNPTNQGMGGKGMRHPDSFVAHLFLGSWKRQE
jgi:mannosyltransferase OCH1-like enzyme